ncbi:ABC transporter permease [candidate division KSB1 bacterium]|nr:ABC transporter permease [candidate division KSB1 bacterium]
MIVNYFKILLRTMRKHLNYSLINLFGLTVGMATCILILLFVRYEQNWNTSYPDADRIYRVQQIVQFKNDTDIATQTGYALAHELKANFPEFEETATINEIHGEYLSSTDELTFQERKGYYAENSIFTIFSSRFLEGNASDALTDPFSVVLTKELAQKYFPNESAVGKFIKASKNKLLEVTGVVEDLPFNVDIRPEYFVSLGTVEHVTTWKEYNDLSNITVATVRTIVLIKPHTSVGELNDKICNFNDRYVPDNYKKLYLKPITELHIAPDETSDYKVALDYMAGISLFVLLLACINFINLATANSNLRKKEIGIRKVIGGNKSAIFGQFIGEFLFYSFISMILAFLVAELTLPCFNNIVERPLDINYVADFHFILILLALFTITGLVAGIYPSLYLSAFQPAQILKDNLGSRKQTSSKTFIRKFLVAFQFIISVTIILSTIYVSKQVRYMKTKDHGFNRNDLIMCRVSGNNVGGDFETLKSRLLQNPAVTSASYSINAPFHGNWGREINWEGCAPDDKMGVSYNLVSYDFINTFQINIVKGRDFSPAHATDKNACIINEEACRQLGWDDPIGKKLDNNKYTVIGVAKDFHIYGVHSKIPAYMMMLKTDDMRHGDVFAVRVQPGSGQATREAVTQTFRSSFPDAIVDAYYFNQRREYGGKDVWELLEQIFFAFSIIAIAIAANGLYGLISFAVQRRIKEIGIRKVLGARASQLYYLISKEFLGLLLLSVFISCPLGYVISITTPGAYKYHLIPMDYIVSIGLMLLTALFATMYHTTQAVLSNPADTLKYE